MSRAFKRPGFTLIELILSVAIVSVLSVVLFINFSNQNRKAAVRQGANQIALDLQRMYTQAQAGVQQAGVTQLGYGLSLEASQTSYKTFFDRPGATADNEYTNATELLLQRNLPANIIIADIQEKDAAGNFTSRARADVLYRIPGASLAVRVGTASPLSVSTKRIIITVRHNTLTNLTQCVAITPSIGAVNLTCS